MWIYRRKNLYSKEIRSNGCYIEDIHKIRIESEDDMKQNPPGGVQEKSLNHIEYQKPFTTGRGSGGFINPSFQGIHGVKDRISSRTGV